MARRTRQERQVPPQRLILDSGTVVSLSRGEGRPRAILRRAMELSMEVRIPVAVLVETLRWGARDAPIHRVRNAVEVFPTNERTGRLEASLLGYTGGTNTVDALVAAEAVVARADVLTGDPDDLRRLLAEYTRVGVIPL
jgi:predicted nucleic acid-binding protein